MSNIEDIVIGMEILGADGVHLGTVDGVTGRRIRLRLTDSGEGSHKNHHHYLPYGLVAAVARNQVHLSANANVATLFEEEHDGQARS